MAKAKSERDEPLDLFGEPLRLAEKGRGRPAHAPNRETQNRVILGFARGWSVKEVALSIGVSVPTLRAHYSSAVARRHAMTLMMESVQLGRLNDQAEKGNVAAEKELLKVLAKGQLQQLPKSMKAAKAPKLGKKEQRKADAASGHEQSTWGDLVGDTGEQPRLQ